MPTALELAKAGVYPATPRHPSPGARKPKGPPEVHIPTTPPEVIDPWDGWPPKFKDWPPWNRPAPNGYDEFASLLMALWNRLSRHRLSLGLAPGYPYINLSDRMWAFVPNAVNTAVRAFTELWNNHGIASGHSLKVEVTGDADTYGGCRYTPLIGSFSADMHLYFYDDMLTPEFNIEFNAEVSTFMLATAGYYTAGVMGHTGGGTSVARSEGWHRLSLSQEGPIQVLQVDGAALAAADSGESFPVPLAYVDFAVYLPSAGTGTLYIDDLWWVYGDSLYKEGFETTLQGALSEVF
jgi:hypothetical protein